MNANPHYYLDQYHGAAAELRDFRQRAYPPGLRVQVACAQYTGPGEVAEDGNCPIDKLPVRLCNGNVWWYPMESCQPAKRMPPTMTKTEASERACQRKTKGATR